MDVTIRSHHPGYPVSVVTWSQPADLINGEECIVLTHLGSKIGEEIPADSEFEGFRYTPSGNFREVMVGYQDYSDQITVGEMHVQEGLKALATYLESTKSEIQAKYKITFPTAGEWTLMGTTTRYSAGEVGWNSQAAGYTRRMDTLFNTRREMWQYQEEDGDIPGVWHTVEAWDEQYVISHDGSAKWGTSDGIETTRDGKPIDEVQEGDWGHKHVLSPGCWATDVSASTWTISCAWNRNGISASASTTYTSQSSWRFENVRDAGGDDVGAYDYDSTRKVWYVTTQ